MSRPDVLAPGSARRIYLRLIGYAKPYWRMFALSVVGMLVYAATEPVFAAMMKPLLDGTFIDRDPAVVQAMPLILLAIFLVRGISGFINTYCLKWVGRRVVADLRQQMFEHLLRSPARYYDRWWTAGSERVAPSLLACQGLPDPEGFAALLAGDWAGRGWLGLGPG